MKLAIMKFGGLRPFSPASSCRASFRRRGNASRLWANWNHGSTARQWSNETYRSTIRLTQGRSESLFTSLCEELISTCRRENTQNRKAPRFFRSLIHGFLPQPIFASNRRTPSMGGVSMKCSATGQFNLLASDLRAKAAGTLFRIRPLTPQGSFAGGCGKSRLIT